MIEIKNISKSFGDRKVIDDVSFTFEQGKTNLIIVTTLLSLAGIIGLI